VDEPLTINLGGPSNERLIGQAPSPVRPRAEVLADLRAARDGGAGRVLLTGGEPTLRRDLLSIVRAARRLRLGVGLATNGRTLIYPRLREALLTAGVEHLRVSLHAATAAIHDRMVGVPGAYGQTLAALRALLSTDHALPPRVEITYTLTDDNADQAGPLAELVATLPGQPRLVQLRPEPIPNSFNFELDRDLPEFTLDPAACSAGDLALPDPERHLLLAQEAGVSLYRTPTRDFSARQIRQVKEETEQLYLDVSGSAAVGAQARNVRRARAHEACQGCEYRPTCCGAFALQEGDPFAAEEAWLRGVLGELTGSVLDVGCGEQPYSALLEGKIQAGEITYLGLDPDGPALARLRGRGFPGRLVQAQVEHAPLAGACFDQVLALRTVNHVLDLPRALAVMARLLRPGGRLLLSDMTIYGLLRRPEQVARADATGRDQEHHQNLDGAGVLALLGPLPLELVEHRPVTRQTSNEWFLLLRRLPDQEAPA